MTQHTIPADRKRAPGTWLLRDMAGADLLPRLHLVETWQCCDRCRALAVADRLELWGARLDIPDLPEVLALAWSALTSAGRALVQRTLKARGTLELVQRKLTPRPANVRGGDLPMSPGGLYLPS